MKVTSFTFHVDNFDNAAMVEDRTGEVCRMLRDIANRIQEYGLPHVDGTRIMDANGNQVGLVQTEFEEEEAPLSVRVESFTMEECRDWLVENDVDAEDWPTPNPWHSDRAEILTELGYGPTEDSTAELRQELIDVMENGAVDKYRQFIIDHAEANCLTE